jgi:AraC-like DNA-binding protein
MTTEQVDQLSQALDIVAVRAVLTGGFATHGPWAVRAPVDAPLKFFAIVSGRASLRTDGIPNALELGTGDVAILNARSWVELRGGGDTGPAREIDPPPGVPNVSLARSQRGTDDVVIGGAVDLDPAGRALLQQALGPVGHVRAHAAGPLRTVLDRLLDEVTSGRPGSAYAVRLHGHLLLLEVLRTYAGQDDVPPGWLRLLADERLRPALQLMHAEPGRAWGLAELARAATMSRTSFAERFRAAAGMPPLVYLSRWRMLLAQRALRHRDASVAALADELGFASASAFSTAFKREVGQSPLHYRQAAS